MQEEKLYIQHGNISVYTHSLNVAYVSIVMANKLHMHVNQNALIRGALLHDYFQYDWHIKGNKHRWHGFTHPMIAYKNAIKEFELSDLEKDIILKHMFPLKPIPHKYRESIIVGISDKMCAIYEMVSTYFKIENFGWGEL